MKSGMSVFAKIWNVPNNIKTQKMNLYTSERWLLVLAFKQKKVLKKSGHIDFFSFLLKSVFYL